MADDIVDKQPETETAENEKQVPEAPMVGGSDGLSGQNEPPSQPGPAAPAGPQPESRPPQIVVSDRGGKSWVKILIVLLVILLLAGGIWYALKHKNSKPVATATVSKDIPLLRINILSADYGNPYPDVSDNDYAFSVNSQMFEGLVRYENKSKIVPDLASDWTNPDNNTWIFTIKKDVKFHDGHTLAPSDVKASLDKITASDGDFAQTFATTIASVELVGKDQVKITTKSPDPTLLNKLAWLYIIDANPPKGAEPSQAGTGAYMIKPGTKPTDTSYQMVAFDGYHFGRPETRALTFGTQKNNTDLLKTFNSGQSDISGAVNPDTIKQAKKATTFEVDEPDCSFLGFNTVKSSPVQNKSVREAIRYAVNAKAIGKANETTLTPLSQLIPPSIPGYNPAITPYKQDIAKAKQLLAQAGYPNGVTITVSASDADAAEINELTQELKQVGITLNYDKHTDFDEFIGYFTGGQAQMYIIDYASDTLDGADIYTTTLPTANYDNPKVTDLITKANTTVNPATRLKLLQEAGTLIDQDVAVVPLGSTSDLWVMNKNYAVHQDMPTGSMPVYFYKVHLN